MPRTSAATIVLLTIVAGCNVGDDANPTSRGFAWSGSERDSAGIRIVSNPSSGIWTETTRWTVERDLAVGEAEGDPAYQFGRVVDIDVADDGRIYVLDQQAAQVSVFDVGGSHLFSFGRPGEGPGEMSNQSPLGALAVLMTPDEVLVPDRVNARVGRFSVDGNVIGTFPLRVENGEPVRSSILPNGAFVLHRVERSPSGWSGLVELGSDGEILDTILEFDLYASPWGMSAPDAQGRRQALEHAPLWAIMPDGRIVSGRSDQYLIDVRDSGGRLQMLVLREEDQPDLTDEGRQRFQDRLIKVWGDMFRRRGDPEEHIRSQLSQVDDIYILPERLPAFTGFAAGPEGTIWVRRALPVEAMTSHLLGPRAPLREFWSANWDVFSREGRFLGEVRLPPQFTLFRIKDRFIYGMETDELGVQRVVRLRIRIP